MAKTTPARSKGSLSVLARRSPFTRQVVLPAENFIHSESISALFLLAAAIIALAWANSPWAHSYFGLLETVITVKVGPLDITETVHHWINDGLMTLFFFVVALEIKRELVRGELSSVKKAALPLAGAFGGMLVPVIIFLGFNYGKAGAHGWGIPMATDIAFALGVLALLGNRIPFALRVFLLAYAIADDIGAILVIAVFYTNHISYVALAWGAAIIFAIQCARVAGVRDIPVYIILGALLWVAVLESGIHATIAGVLLGFMTPASAWFGARESTQQIHDALPGLEDSVQQKDYPRTQAILGELEVLTHHTEAPLERIERIMHPWTSFLVLPIFALANAGVAFSPEMARSALSSPVTLGIAAGLLVGKLFGLTTFSWLAVKLGAASLPNGVGWRHIWGTAFLGAVGFTVAIFISGLAYDDARMVDQAKIGILASSLVAAVVGWLFLRFAVPPARE